ncbi:MAG: hypothetical protein LAP61_14410 [Acidobacteriia bacterium]|nr:hypothetical protein [Terriglobia bacterium]
MVNSPYRLRLVFLVMVTCLPAAFSQDPRTFVTPAASAVKQLATTAKTDVIDKVMGVVGPDESTLTEQRRFHLYLVATAGPVPILAEAAGAGIGQWENSPKEWGQGWGAYGERFGSNLAYNGVRQTITYGTSILFHEDNRYFASHKHGLWARTGYAVLSTFTARNPDGQTTFSISSVTGVVGASAIASLWGPESWKGVGNISRNAGISFGATAGFNLVREFLPDFLHRPQK